jgi:tripartite-type tricarboxylate transporter receptor subunit TctC
VVDKLQSAVVAALGQPDTARRLTELAFVPVGSTPAELAEHCRKEIAKFEKLVRSIGLQQQ